MKFTEATKSEKRALRILADYRPQKRSRYVWAALTLIIDLVWSVGNFVAFVNTGNVFNLGIAVVVLSLGVIIAYDDRHMWAGVFDRFKDERERRRESVEGH